MTDILQVDNDRESGIRRPSWLGPLVIGLECALICGLLGVWVFSEAARRSIHPAVLFFYSFPSEFLIGLVPHEPVLLYFGRVYPAHVVALIAVSGTVLAEWMNYLFFGIVNETALFESMRKKNMVKRIIRLFGKAPFAAIVFAGFTPVPFFPVRFLVVMGCYPISRYLLGVFVSRAPRFYILAKAGSYFNIPGWCVAVLFAVLLAVAYVPAIRSYFMKNRTRINRNTEE